LPRDHRYAELAADSVGCRQITRIGPDVRHENGLAGLRGRPDDSFAGCDYEVADDILPMSDGMADAQFLPLVIVEQNGEELIRNHALDDRRGARKKIIQVERLRHQSGNFEQEVQQVRSLAKLGRFGPGGGHISIQRARSRRHPPLREFARWRWRRSGWPQPRSWPAYRRESECRRKPSRRSRDRRCAASARHPLLLRPSG